MDEPETEALTLALLDAAIDKDLAVQNQVGKSLLTLGKQQTDLVLTMCQDYLVKHPKLNISHRVVILQTIELIVISSMKQVSAPRMKSIISMASDEMTRSKELIFDWQKAASDILVAVGKHHINEIMEELLSKFQPGIMPHYFVVQTLASLSNSNVYGMVPFVNAIVGTMLPMLNAAKNDQMKWVFSSALRHFSENILEYLANLDKAPDPTVRKDAFACDISCAFDILFYQWLQSKDVKLKMMVVEAVGFMCHLLPSDKLEDQIPKIIPAILSLYKRHDPFTTSTSLCQVLDAAVQMGSRVLETQMENLLPVLHLQISNPVDYSNPPTVKNHNEVLRCFSLLVILFPDRVVTFVLQKLETTNERNRLGSLAVLRHLINSSSSKLESKKQLILANIRQPMTDNSNRVKKGVVQVISAMAHHGYLELDGGDLLVRFIVQNCALPDTPEKVRSGFDQEEVTNELLRSMCDNTLHLLTTTVGQLADVLWPKLLYYLTPSQFSNATTPLCNSLIVLGNKKKQDKHSNFHIDFARESNLPSPQTLMIRLLVNAAFPFNCRGQGGPSLLLLQTLSTNFHSNTATYWEAHIPALVSYLEENDTEFDKAEWDKQVLELLSNALKLMADDKWVCRLAIETTKYLPTYNNSLEEKKFLYKCMGVTLQHCQKKEVVQKQLQEILTAAQHADLMEREGVALAIGLCASRHLEGTLAKLEEFGKSDLLKRTASIFHLLKDRHDDEVEKVKSTLVLCYGRVAQGAPSDKLLQHIDHRIMRHISKYFNVKDLTMKISLIESTGFIAKAIGECVKNQGYIFNRKQELINVMLNFIKSEPADSLKTPVRHLAMSTCADLIPLDPPLNENENYDLIHVCVKSVFSLPNQSNLQEKCKEDDSLDPQQKKILYKETFKALEELLNSILDRDNTPDGLQGVFKHIEPWLSSEPKHERGRAITTTAHILAHYLDNLNVKNMVSFHNLGSLLGRLSPRCSDPHPAVRFAAVDCIYALLSIQLRYEGFSLNYKDEAVESLLPLKEQLENPDKTVLYRTCSDLTTMMSRRLPNQQLATLVFVLFDGLVDSQINCCRASSVILNTLLKNRGTGLQDLVPEMLEVLHLRLQEITEEQVKLSVGQSLLILASQHLETVILTLISQPLPYDSSISEMWLALGAEPTISKQIMEILMEKLLVLPPYLEKESLLVGAPTKIATSQPLAMTCSLKELLINGQSQEPVLSLFPQLFSCLFVRLGTSIGILPPKEKNSKQTSGIHVAGAAADALRILLGRAQLHEVNQILDDENVWLEIIEPKTHVAAVIMLARVMAKHAGPKIPAIVDCLCPSLNSVYECQRISITAFFSEVLNHHVATELKVLDVLLNNMMERISDSVCTVRMLAVRGLGNLAVGSPEKVNKYAKELLAAMSSGMEEKDDPDKLIIYEAMSGLSKVLPRLEKEHADLFVVYIFMKIKPFLESENDNVRCAAIFLMGNLCKFGSGEQVFKDQIHNVLVSLLLHLNDPSLHVVMACKYTMRVCAPYVDSEHIAAMFQKHLIDDHFLHYGEFINNLTKYLVQDFPGMLNFYHITVIQFFKSMWPEIRAAAAMFIGFLMFNLHQDHICHINMGTITKGLVMLLQDPDPVVRAKAAEAMGHFNCNLYTQTDDLNTVCDSRYY